MELDELYIFEMEETRELAAMAKLNTAYLE
jgi:hypothetical protein